jgi:hypothetical protein
VGLVVDPEDRALAGAGSEGEQVVVVVELPTAAR